MHASTLLARRTSRILGGGERACPALAPCTRLQSDAAASIVWTAAMNRKGYHPSPGAGQTIETAASLCSRVQCAAAASPAVSVWAPAAPHARNAFVQRHERAAIRTAPSTDYNTCDQAIVCLLRPRLASRAPAATTTGAASRLERAGTAPPSHNAATDDSMRKQAVT